MKAWAAFTQAVSTTALVANVAIGSRRPPTFREDIVDDMASAAGMDESARMQRLRIGILSNMDQVSDPALRFLILRMNTIQGSFEFEFLPFDPTDPFLVKLLPGSIVDREEIRDSAAAFRIRQTKLFDAYNQGFNTKESPPNHLMVLSTARFADNHYNMRSAGISVVALGNWRRSMAPPSILEFVLTLTIREAIASACRTLSESVHLGTKGCPAT
jgi:hypothetical protein